MRAVFGIRHHGPGSARSLLGALEAMAPDVILVEGPPDAAEVLPLALHAQMRPPVALLIYRPDAPRRAVYYPFATFSPEWQAIRFGLGRGVAVRFMDLPQAYQLGQEENRNTDETDDMRRDPLRHLASLSGYGDGERWWEHLVEERRDDEGIFVAILEAMTMLRGEADAPGARVPVREARREAFMRQTIRAAEKEGFQRIAIVCGAWHAPALVELLPAKADAALLRGLPKVKVRATWVPWTQGRLSLASGYGAGVSAPGWYQHLYNSTPPEPGRNPGSNPENGPGHGHVAQGWLARVARVLREADLDAPPSQVVDAVRLAEALASLRGRPLPGLPELDDAAETVLCHGQPLPMRLVREKLVVGETIGAVPDDTPMVPLAQDLEAERRRLRLPQDPKEKMLDLDLRKESDLARSHLLHRLRLLDVSWGEPDASQAEGAARGATSRMGAGTFHELWTLKWEPELSVAVIEAAVWGNTVRDAATARASARSTEAPDGSSLPSLTELLDRVLHADLPDAVQALMARIETEAALGGDVLHLAAALPPLVNVLRYGSVRRTDVGAARHVVEGMVARICIGLGGACASLDDTAAKEMLGAVIAVDGAIRLLGEPAHMTAWHAALSRLADPARPPGLSGLPGLHHVHGPQGVHGLVAGRAARLLLDAGALDGDEAVRRAGFVLSPGAAPSAGAAWVEGFLRGSGLLLVHDERLWQVIDRWVSGLSEDTFAQLLPLLRRTFATFAAPERQKLGERARRGTAATTTANGHKDSDDFDEARAAASLPVVLRLLGLASPSLPSLPSLPSPLSDDGS